MKLKPYQSKHIKRIEQAAKQQTDVMTYCNIPITTELSKHALIGIIIHLKKINDRKTGKNIR